MGNREALETEIKQLEEKATYFRRHGNEQEYETKLAEANQKREELDQLTKAAIIAEARDPESSFTLTVDGMTVDFRAESANEGSYQALRIVTQLKLQELEQQNQAELKALKVSYESERQQYELQISSLEELKADAAKVIETLKRDYKELDGQLHAASMQIADRDSKLSIAASEIESLKAQVEELRTQVSKPSVPTNLDNGALAEAIKASQAAKPAIYDVEKDQANINFTAKLLETDEVVEGKVVYIGKYRIADTAEVTRFQQEREAAEAAIASIAEHSEDDTALVESEPEAAEVPQVDTFREDENDTVPEHTIHGEVDAIATANDGGETFEQRTERRLALLEAQAFGEIKAVA